MNNAGAKNNVLVKIREVLPGTQSETQFLSEKLRHRSKRDISLLLNILQCKVPQTLGKIKRLVVTMYVISFEKWYHWRIWWFEVCMPVCTQRTSRKFYHTNSETNVCVKRYETSWCRFRRCYWGQTTEGLTLAATQIPCNRTIAYCCLSLEFWPGVRKSMGHISWKRLSYRCQNILKVSVSHRIWPVSHDMFLFYFTDLSQISH